MINNKTHNHTNKRVNLENGLVFSIPLSDGSFTVAQLVNHHKITPKQSVDTYAFFNFKFDNRNAVLENYVELQLNSPFSILTSSGFPWQFSWEPIGKMEVTIDRTLLKENIGQGGYFKQYSIAPSLVLEPYFGLFPWDGYYKDDYLEEHLLPNVKPRNDVRFMKDYSTKELQNILPLNSLKLIKRIKEESNK